VGRVSHSPARGRLDEIAGQHHLDLALRQLVAHFEDHVGAGVADA
jgi:hypothetical protein